MPRKYLATPLSIGALGPDAKCGVLTPRNYPAVGESLETQHLLFVPREFLATPRAIGVLGPDDKWPVITPRNYAAVGESLESIDTVGVP